MESHGKYENFFEKIIKGIALVFKKKFKKKSKVYLRKKQGKKIKEILEIYYYKNSGKKKYEN